ncbi:hypothetical protein T06_14176 [Trichinella sp. T6]|nr:hypothetical protein T06_14176 [Trichinella sp. T6]
MTTELKLCFIKLIANLCSEQSNIRRNTPSPVEIHSPPHRLSTTAEDLNYGIYVITWVGYKYNSNQIDTI